MRRRARSPGPTTGRGRPRAVPPPAAPPAGGPRSYRRQTARPCRAPPDAITFRSEVPAVRDRKRGGIRRPPRRGVQARRGRPLGRRRPRLFAGLVGRWLLLLLGLGRRRIVDVDRRQVHLRQV